jgi:hypothetical protein
MLSDENQRNYLIKLLPFTNGSVTEPAKLATVVGSLCLNPNAILHAVTDAVFSRLIFAVRLRS